MFNRNDLDAVTAVFTEHAIYDEFNGKRNRGTPAYVRPSNRSSVVRSGIWSSSKDDIFVDAEAGKAMIPGDACCP